MAEIAMPISTPGSGTPRMPSTPPTAITSGNTTGRMKIAGAPRNAPHSPTATIAADVVGAEHRMREPADEAAGDAAGVGERGGTRQQNDQNRNAGALKPHEHSVADFTSPRCAGGEV